MDWLWARSRSACRPACARVLGFRVMASRVRAGLGHGPACASACKYALCCSQQLQHMNEVSASGGGKHSRVSASLRMKSAAWTGKWARISVKGCPRSGNLDVNAAALAGRAPAN